jgi:hypothetical protein
VSQPEKVTKMGEGGVLDNLRIINTDKRLARQTVPNGQDRLPEESGFKLRPG